MFTQSNVEKNFYAENVLPQNRGKCFSVKDAFGAAIANNKLYVGDAKVHDANFAFLTTTLAKLITKPAEPLHFVTYGRDIDIDYGGGFVDYVTQYEVNWAGMMNEFRNVMGNNANYIPRVNAGLSQKKYDVYTFEVAYDLRWVELEKMKQIDISKSIQDIYQNAIMAGADLFSQKVAYEGIGGHKGLFNHDDRVQITMIDNSGASATHAGFKGMTDEAVTSWFNGMFAYYLVGGGMNLAILPNRILVPSFVGKDLTGRMSALYTSTLRKFLTEFNLAKDEAEDESFKVVIVSRPGLDNAGTNGVGRIVAYRKDKAFLRLDVPWKMQHYITLPNMDKMAYTSAFVMQISEIIMPYNVSNEELGVISYWDFTK